MTEPIDSVKNDTTLYSLENGEIHLVLSEKQKDDIRAITESIVEVDENIKRMAVPDVIHTLENGNSLNRLLTNPDGKVTGYIACENWGSHEAYLKYLGTTRNTGRNFFREIPAFLEYAKEKGYTKLNFHGWNNRLNNILERYGFKHVRDDEMANLKVGFFEKRLT
ncbi:MAG: hypothetical protein ABIJ82_00150 [Patescibacteria group bacterium]